MLKMLNSLEQLDMDGNTAALEIWIDRSKTNLYDKATLKAAYDFEWGLGSKRVHVQQKHVGIYGQWIDTWHPFEGSKEIALILEDDVSVSPHAWKWIKAVNNKYGNRSDVLGITLQMQRVQFAIGGQKTVRAPSEDTVFMYRRMGSWGFSPHPRVWADFQDWFHEKYKDKSFHPYIGGGVVFDQWYKIFEKEGRSDSMWTIWFIYYTEKVRTNLYCVYSNLNDHLKGDNHSISVNRQEPGLHYKGKKGVSNEHLLLKTWNHSYINFPKKIAKFEFSGKMNRDV